MIVAYPRTILSGSQDHPVLVTSLDHPPAVGSWMDTQTGWSRSSSSELCTVPTQPARAEKIAHQVVVLPEVNLANVWPVGEGGRT